MIPQLLGGVGMFMLGMTLMTEGLRLLAGDSLRRFLERFTKSRASGLLTGAVATAVIQSSSATTLITIGFVNARLIDFGQALGLIYGANLGTTTTAWVVAIVGFKVDVSALALPLVGVGAGFRLVGRGAWQAAGTGLAGFGLLFVGLEVLQRGMGGFASAVDLSDVGAGIAGRLLLCGIGAGMTVVMQSSSASMAVTLTALHAGAIDLSQAAAMVVGQNVGTTVTAGLAAVGGSAAAKRTALAHVAFNVGTGAVAFLLLTPAGAALAVLKGRYGWEAVTALSAFHTAFNVLGVALFLPITARFAALIEGLVKEAGGVLERPLDTQLLGSPTLALEAAQARIGAAARIAIGVARRAVASFGAEALAPAARDQLERADDKLADAQRYIARLRTERTDQRVYAKHLGLVHAIDHLQRLTRATREAGDGEPKAGDAELSEVAREADLVMAEVLAWLADPVARAAPVEQVARASQAFADRRKAFRHRLLDDLAAGAVTADEGEAKLEAIRWMDRIYYHVWRATHHLGSANGASSAPAPSAPAPAPPAEPPPAP